MKNAFAQLTLAPLGFFVLGLGVVGASCYRTDASTQQVADPNFDAAVAHPAYVDEHPKVLFDEAHSNFHTTQGRYEPFVDLITNDGYQVTANKVDFEKEVLESYNILVIANAVGAESIFSPEAGMPAFTDNEADAVRDWVSEGGSLLLIADHPPFGAAAEILSQRFAVDMSKAWTLDESNSHGEWSPGFIQFTRDNGLLGDHPITRGRNPTERIHRAMTFTGQSLKGPDASVAFLVLAETVVDVPNLDSAEGVSAGGRAQGIAMQFGKGRVVVLGEAGMLSAQLFGEERRPFGMNHTGYDNRQLVLNIMHWLSRLLP